MLFFLGSLTSFLVFNFPPARIFLGDTGSQLLGWILALSIIHLSYFYSYSNPKLYLISFLSVPFYDVFYVMYIRFYEAKGPLIYRLGSIVKSDQNHVHHLLLSMGYSKKAALFLILLLHVFLLIIALIPIYLNSFYILTLILSASLFILFRLYFGLKA